MPAAASIYISTRGLSPAVDFSEALLRGVAPDGGLYVPSRWPALAPEAMTAHSARETAHAVLRPFVGDALPDEALTRATWRLTEGFLEPEVTPLVQQYLSALPGCHSGQRLPPVLSGFPHR